MSTQAATFFPINGMLMHYSTNTVYVGIGIEIEEVITQCHQVTVSR